MKRGGVEAELAKKELAGPEIPEEALYLWAWFCELLSARHVGPGGPETIDFTEISSWARLTRRSPTPWEVDMLRDLDDAWLSARAEAKRT